MAYRIPRTIKKSFANYSVESEKELEELSNLKLMVANGSTKEQRVYISIDKPQVIEIRIYDLSNFSVNIYHDFNRKVKNLFQ